MSSERTSLDISIVIPSYNRFDDLLRTVDRCLDLNPRPCEIVIVVDCSAEDPTPLLRRMGGDCIRVLRLPENHGIAGARSIGFAAARGKYIVSLDDDSWFLDSNALDQVWNRLEALPNCGILALRTLSPGVPMKSASDRLMLVADHIGCAHVHRAQVLHRSGYYLGFLRTAGEESELSLKAMDAGFDVVLDESIVVFHQYDPTRRSRASLARYHAYGVRNDLLRPWIFFPADLAVAVSAWRLISHVSFAVRRGAVGSTVRGLAEYVQKLPQAISFRQPVSRTAALRYLKLRRRPQALTVTRELGSR